MNDILLSFNILSDKIQKKKFKQTGYNNSQTSLLTQTNQQTNTKFKYKLKSAKTSAGQTDCHLTRPIN